MRQTLHPAFWHTVLNFISYSLWTLGNKKIFSRWEDYPLLSTGLQMGVVTAIAVGMQRVTLEGAGESIPLDVIKKSMVPLSVVRSSDLGFANIALCLMTVASQQILKATIPVWVCLLSTFYLKRPISIRGWFFVMLIVIGTATATVGDPNINASLFGVVAMLISCFCRAGKCIINTQLLQGSPAQHIQQKFNKLTLLRYEAPMSGSLIIIASMFVEIRGFSLPEGWLEPFFYFTIATLINGILMFFNQVTYLGIVEHTGPVTSQTLMNLKMIFLILISTTLYPIHITKVNGAGMMLATVSAILYSYHSEPKQKREAPASPLGDVGVENMYEGRHSQRIII